MSMVNGSGLLIFPWPRFSLDCPDKPHRKHVVNNHSHHREAQERRAANNPIIALEYSALNNGFRLSFTTGLFAIRLTSRSHILSRPQPQLSTVSILKSKIIHRL